MARLSPFVSGSFKYDLGTLGYSTLLADENYEVMDGFSPNGKSREVLDLMFGGGIGISVALGRAF